MTRYRGSRIRRMFPTMCLVGGLAVATGACPREVEPTFPFEPKMKMSATAAALSVGGGGCDQVYCGGNTSFIGGFPLDELDLSGRLPNSGGFYYRGVRKGKLRGDKLAVVGGEFAIEDGGTTYAGRDVIGWRIQVQHKPRCTSSVFRYRMLESFNSILRRTCPQCKAPLDRRDVLALRGELSVARLDPWPTMWEIEIQNVYKVLHWPVTWEECSAVFEEFGLREGEGVTLAALQRDHDLRRTDVVNVTADQLRMCFVTAYDLVVHRPTMGPRAVGHYLCKPQRSWGSYWRHDVPPATVRVDGVGRSEEYEVLPWWKKTFAAVLAGDEVYDTTTGDVLGTWHGAASLGTGWFSIGCAGSAVGKLQLLRYDPQPVEQKYATKSSERQAALKMLTAKYCARVAGTQATDSGTPLLWENDRKWFQPPQHECEEGGWSAQGAQPRGCPRESPKAVAAMSACAGSTAPAGKDWQSFVPQSDQRFVAE